MYRLVFSILLFSITNLALADNAAEKVYKDVSNSVFTIYNVNHSDPTHTVNYGSGIAIAPHIIVTNCHVALHGEEHLINIQHRFQKTEVVYQDQNDDLCLLQTDQNILKPVPVRSSTRVNIGEEVFTIGSPKGLDKSISRGIISNKIHYKDSVVLQTDAAISPGSSGGGLFDRDSHLIGITFLKDEGLYTEGIGFALPTEVLAHAMKSSHLLKIKFT